MARVHADPDKLKQYAKEMRAAGEELEQRSRSLLKRLNSIDWDDSERYKFEQELSAVVNSLAQFSRRLRDEHAPKLERKAQALEAFRS